MRRKDPKIVRLAKVALFSKCDEKELRRIASIVDQTSVPAGTMLTRQGARSDQCFFLLEGEAEVAIDGGVVGHIGPGESAGEMGLIEHEPRLATVTATTDLEVFAVQVTLFDGLLDESPALARALLAELSSRLRRIEQSELIPA